ncbi:MAG: ampG3 [Caulobacteraceae bacterium]|nr:ampG3 [Caulobacteraceae bacterium]
MSDGEQATPAVLNKPRARRASMREVLRALSRPRVLVMLLLGFSSGVPFMLTANTLSYWLREDGLSLKTIGFLSWVGLAYSLKFLWAPLIDRLDVPFAGKLGRRRGWLLLSQVVIGAALVGMALTGPTRGLVAFGALALTVAFASSTQDIVVDAWRIEAAETAEELGLLSSAHQLGYRIALLCTDALILVLAQFAGWTTSYVVAGAAMSIGVAATLMAREPARADAVMHAKSDAAPLWSPRGLFDAIVGPFVEFFRAHGAFALVMLLTITLYHLSDYLRGPISNPFYHDAGYSKLTVGAIRSTIGLWGTFLGLAAGGLCSVRIGFFKTLIAGAVLQPLGIAGFCWVALAGTPNDLLFTAVMTFDNFAIGFSGVALVAYMSSLTSLGYTASQYAVMSSALAWTGKTLKGFSGLVVESLQQGRDLMHAYALFYAGAAALGVPAIFLCFVLARAASQRTPRAAAD